MQPIKKLSDNNKIKSQLEAEINPLPNGFDYEMKWVETSLYDTSTVGLQAEVKVEVSLPKKTIVIDPVRYTLIFEKFDEITHY